MRNEDYFDKPSDLAMADQLEAHYQNEVAKAVAAIISFKKAGKETSPSIEAKHQWDALWEGGEINRSMVASLTFLYTTSVLLLADMSMDIMAAAEEAGVDMKEFMQMDWDGLEDPEA